MPIYEYQCASCGHHLEAFQKMTEPMLTECPKCHKKDLQKLVSAAGFQLKGTGWYATDFRDQGKKKIEQSSGDTVVEKKETKDPNNTKETKDKDSKASSESNTTKKSTDTGTAASS